MRSSWLTTERNSFFMPVDLATLGDVAEDHDRAADLGLVEQGRRGDLDREDRPVGADVLVLLGAGDDPVL